MGPAFLPQSLDLLGLAVLVAKASMQWEGQSAWVQVSASNEELQKMFAERERTARPHQPPSRTQELVSMGGDW